MISAANIQPGTGTFPTFVSVSLIDLAALVTLVVILIVLAVKYLKPGPSTTRLLSRGRQNLGAGGLMRIFASELVNRVMFQRDVISDRTRRFAHLCMFWGFVGLGVTTTADYIFNQPGNYIPLFGGTLSWIRLLGNISGVIMVLGASITIARLIGVPTFRERISFSDAWFAVLLFLVGVTGFLAEYLGDVAHSISPDIPPAAQYTISSSANLLIAIPYGTHLVLIALLFLSAPVSAFIHALRVPSLRYMDGIGNALARKQQEQQSNTDGEAEGETPAGPPIVQNSLRSIKEEIMIEQIKSHYETPKNREQSASDKEDKDQPETK
ncbi:MAG TPA: respiratory nitrate reductase subunit gamma [Nitrososphaerales archaeon]|nr:respiratory nitrate reductase subunit gamma [Nitrososphaerales archaeon]